MSQTGGRAWAKAFSSGMPWPYCWDRPASRRISRARPQRITGGSMPSPRSPSRMRRAWAASPPRAASIRPKTSKRALSATAACTVAASIWLPSASSLSFSISWAAASRLPSTRAAISSRASGLADRPAWDRRWRIHCGNWWTSTGQTWMNCAALPSIRALAHLVFCVLPSSLGRLSRSTVSSGGRCRYSWRIAAPLSPGLPEGRRSSIRRFSANSDRLAPASSSKPQSKLASALNTWRSPKSRSRQAWRMASQASWQSSGSSPLTT